MALKHGRRFLGIELFSSYVKLAHKRIEEHANQMQLDLGGEL